MLLAELHAENVALQREVRAARKELESQHLVISRLMKVDPTLPISLLVSLLSITRRRCEDGAALHAAEQNEDTSLVRMLLIEDRESWLTDAASASQGPTFYGQSRRWASLQVERADAERALDSVSQQISLIRERLSKLDDLERQTWGAVASKVARTASRLGVRSRPSSQQSNMTLKPLHITTHLSPSKIPTRVSHSASSKPQSDPVSSETESSISPPSSTLPLPKLPDFTPFSANSDSPPRAWGSDIPFAQLVVSSSQSSRLPIASSPTSASRSSFSSLPPVPPLLPPKHPNRSSASSTLPSLISPSSGADLSFGPITPRSSRFDITELEIRTDPNHELAVMDSLPRVRPLSWVRESEKCPVLPQRHPARGIHRRRESVPFETSSHSIAPFIHASAGPLLNGHPASASCRGLLLITPSLSNTPAPNVISSPHHARDVPGDRADRAGSSLKKLVSRGIFRPAFRNSIPRSRITGPVSSEARNRLSWFRVDRQRLEPLVENWVQEQLELPPPSPSAREREAYFGKAGADGTVKARRPFSVLLKPSRATWLGSPQ